MGNSEVTLASDSPLKPSTSPSARQQSRRERLSLALLHVLLPVGDLVALNVAFLVAYFLRYTLEVGGQIPGEFDVSYHDYIPVQVAMTVIFLITYILKGMYRLPGSTSPVEELSASLSATSIGIMVLFAAVSMARYPASSRGLFVYLWLLAVLVVGLGRLLHRLLMLAAWKRGVGIERVLVVGGGNDLGRRAMHSIATERSPATQVVGFADIDPCEDFGRFRFLGTVREIPGIVAEHRVDTIIIALPAASHDQILRIIDLCRRRRVSFRVAPDLYELMFSRVDTETINGIPLLGARDSQIKGWNLLVKRAMDVSVAVFTMVMLSPLLALISLAIKLDSPGPVLFRQTRVGKDGVPFTVYKFRSMVENAEEMLPDLLSLNEVDGPESRLFKIPRDPRMTRVGKLIRKTSLDELPQLVNVMKGEMSLVGPRPPLPREVEKYEEWHLRRLEASPGITGMWQVSGRSEIPFDEMVMLDIYYVENWSLGLDLKILLRTIPAVLMGGGAF
ncbi:MAG TPA: sugar transferase [Chloroflexota bacterium]